jgi:hypothetical protein
MLRSPFFRGLVFRAGVMAAGGFSLLAVPKVAFMSGSVCARYADVNFALYYEENIRRSMENPGEYFHRKEQEFYASHVKAFQELKLRLQKISRTFPILDLDPGLPSDGSDEDDTDSSPEAHRKVVYPCLTTFTIADVMHTYRISLTIAKPLTREARHKIQAVLTEALHAKRAEEVDETAAIFSAPPPAQTYTSEEYSLYAYFPFAIDSKNREHYSTKLAKTLNECRQTMDRCLAEKAFRKALEAEILPIHAELGSMAKQGYNQESIYRPWGPAVLGGDLTKLVSMRQAKGLVIVVVLMAFNKYDWSKVNTAVGEKFSGK